MTPESQPELDFSVQCVDRDGGRIEVRLEGSLVFHQAGDLWTRLRDQLQSARTVAVVDLSGVKTADGGSVALLLQLVHDLRSRQIETTIVGAPEGVQRILELYQPGKPKQRRRSAGPGFLERLGRMTAELLHEVQLVLSFAGEVTISFIGVLRRPRTGNWGDVPPNMERAGADGLPIVLLINFLVGFIMAFQGAVQLERFGASIYVADLVGLSTVRELGPLMTAIIVCGRSGAAYAAELGTMTVSEEIDALRTMGFDPIRFLVLPRAIGLTLVLPLLTLVADLVAIAGGVLVAVTSLDLTVAAYLTRTQQALDLWDVFSGVGKSVVFALVIALIACQQGLATSGGAEGVGRRTTSSVVSILFALILVDAGFTMVFQVFGL